MSGLTRALGLLLLLHAMSASAHRASDAFLSLQVMPEAGQVQGQWEIALRDLATLMALDSNADRDLTWGELRVAQPALIQMLGRHLRLGTGHGACALQWPELLIHDRSDGRYAWFALQAKCPPPVEVLEIDYRLLFELDPTHRGIVVLTAPQSVHSAVLGPDDAARRFDLSGSSAGQTFADYLVEGVWHIWIGYDHILFLLALLLPAVLSYRAGRWQAQARLRPVLWEVAGVVTAFTLAHSVTLSLAALGLIRLPGHLVEAAIAGSVLLAALNNIRPLVVRARWTVALLFGLIHGFGFASVLGELGLPDGLRVVALLAFNLGVELGQLAIVLAAIPLAFAMRNTTFYRSGLRVAGSLAVALLAAWWLLQRLGLVPD